jgi:phasin family protein
MMSKKTGSFDMLFSANQTSMDELFKTQFHTWEELSKLQSECAHLWVECINAQMQRMSSARNLNDICATETGLVTEYSMKFSDNIRKVYETLENSQKEFMNCFKGTEVILSQPPLEQPERRGKSRSLEVDKDSPRSQVVS